MALRRLIRLRYIGNTFEVPYGPREEADDVPDIFESER